MSLILRQSSRIFALFSLAFLLTPVLFAQGQEAEETDVAFVPDDAFFAMLVRPRQMLEKYGKETKVPLESMFKTARENSGMEIDQLQSVLFVVAFDEAAAAKADDEGERYNEENGFSVVMRFHRAVDQAKIAELAFDHTELDEHEGKKYYKSDSRHAPSVWFPDDKTLVVANDPRMKRLMELDGMGMGSLRHHLRRSDPQADGAIVLSMDTGKAWFKRVFGGEEIPAPMRPILELPTHLDVAVVTADLSQDEPAQLLALAVDEKSAKYLTSVTAEFTKTLKAMLDDNRDEIVQQSPSRRIGTTTVDLCDRFLGGLKLEQDGRKIRGTLHAKGGMVAAAELVVEMFAYQERQSQMWDRYSRVHPLSLGLREYLTAKERFPAAAIRDEEGRPLLSWRVALLPHIGEEELYKEFHLDEPWDSDHNTKLLEKMPAIFAFNEEAGGTTTRLLGVTGEGNFFAGADGLKADALKDEDTIAIVEVPEELAVPWTKPAEFAAGEGALKLLTTGGDEYDSHFLVITADGDVNQLKKSKLTPEVLKGLFSIDGEEELRLYQYSY